MAAVDATGTIDSASARALEDLCEVAFFLGDAISDGDQADRRFEHTTCESAPKPKCRIVLNFIGGSLPEVLGFLHRKMVALLEVRAGPVAVE